MRSAPSLAIHNSAQYTAAAMNHTFRRRPPLLACILGAPWLAGCATWAKHGAALHPPQRLRVAVLPVTVDVELKRLRDIESPPAVPEAPLDERELVRRRMTDVAARITRSLEKRLGDSGFFDAIPPDRLAVALQELAPTISSAPLTAQQARDLGDKAGAQVLLVTRLTGYGRIKRKWLVYMTAAGLAEATVDGVVAAQFVGPMLGAAYAAEEAVRDTFMLIGPALLMNKIYTPVILEGELISAADGKVLWEKTAFDSINRKALKALPPEERRKKEVRLRTASEDAEEALARSLIKRARRNAAAATAP